MAMTARGGFNEPDPDPRVYVDPVPQTELEAGQQAVCDLWARMSSPSSYAIARAVLTAVKDAREKDIAAQHPFMIDGVRHDSGCDLLRSRAFPAEQLKCTCTAVLRSTRRRVQAAERERIAGIIAGLDNTMMDQAKLAAYIRGQETP